MIIIEESSFSERLKTINFSQGYADEVASLAVMKGSDLESLKTVESLSLSKKSAAKKSTKFGMLSVKAGIDKNPNPTQADRIAGAKMKNKKRFV